jgi:NAD(P)-dependent dehydrogenase (short-subunit alcohol dehydrogenase family)
MWTKNDIPDQSGKVVVITGANVGIGYETAIALYEAGAHVVLACRDMERGKLAFEKIVNSAGKGSVALIYIDLSSLASVTKFSASVKKTYPKIDLLINNAGVMIPPSSKTTEGYEMQFGVNFLGHFALTLNLYELLVNAPGSRIVTVTSLAYHYGTINFNNLRLEMTYDPFREYCQSKLADLIFAIELQRRINASGEQLYSVAAHPGVTKSSLSRHMSAADIEKAISQFGMLMDTAQGALSILYAATAKDVIPGGFYGPDSDGGLRGYPVLTEIGENANNEILGKKLWNEGEKMIGKNAS